MFPADGRREQLIKKKLKASLTIEMSLLVPIVLFIFMEIVLSVFYCHDKNILNGAAYEAAVLGSSKERTKTGMSEEELEDFVRDRIRGKCILLTYCQVETSIQEKEVQIRIRARKSGYTVFIEKRAAVTEPEKKVRDRRRLDIKNGEKNND